MKMKQVLGILVFAGVVVASLVFLFSHRAAPASDPRITVTAPVAGAFVTSPLLVTGQARGTWYFEASFPVRLLDARGAELAVIPAQAQGEWMTEEFVPFVATLEFAPPTTDTGVLVLERDNPSGLPENDAEVRVPVRFK